MHICTKKVLISTYSYFYLILPINIPEATGTLLFSWLWRCWAGRGDKKEMGLQRVCFIRTLIKKTPQANHKQKHCNVYIQELKTQNTRLELHCYPNIKCHIRKVLFTGFSLRIPQLYLYCGKPHTQEDSEMYQRSVRKCVSLEP